MTFREIQEYCAALDKTLDKTKNSRLVLITIATTDETGDVVFTCFNPHMRLCKCKDCENLVANVKAQVNNTGAFGELPV